jgi:cell division septal protein FtsQ
MSVSVDPRLADRRRQVRETWARRRLRWIVALVSVVIGAGIGLALVRSPWLAVRSVTVFGAVHAEVLPILEAQNVVAGVPTVSIRPSAIEEALERDPWVAYAEVRVTWPGTIEATVAERIPAGWVEVDGNWMLVSSEGVAVASGTPTRGEPIVRADIGALRLGERIEDPDAIGAFTFLAHLPAELAVDAEVSVGVFGIEASIAGHDVVLGNRRDMDAKVDTLVAVLAAGVEDGFAINLVSPNRPAVSDPRPVVEGTGEDVSSFDDSG